MKLGYALAAVFGTILATLFLMNFYGKDKNKAKALK